MTGRTTSGKPINLAQLQGELVTAGIQFGSSGLGLTEDLVHTYGPEGIPADFEAAVQPAVDAAIAAHVGMRDVTDAELADEFQQPETTAARKQEIRDMQSGLLPREQVPMTGDEVH